MANPTRRTAIKTFGVAIGATSASISLPVATELFANDESKQPIRLGVIADLHGGLAVDAEVRLDAFLKAMQGIETDALVQLGDFAFPNQKHQAFADKFNSAHKNRVHVIGNHEFDYNLSREDCYRAWGIKSAYYRRDLGNLRLIVLDGNQTGSPTQKGYPSFIGNQQKVWLQEELKGADRPVLILSHQPLAGTGAIQNSLEIQELLTRHQHKILLCINGHTHVDSLLQVNGVTYLHINSASYKWVGGATRMAYYKDPLFTTITIDPEKSIVTVESNSSTWKAAPLADSGYFDRDDAPPETIVVPAIRRRKINTRTREVRTDPLTINSKKSPATTHLKVMTWNIWGQLNQDPKYTLNDRNRPAIEPSRLFAKAVRMLLL